MASPFDLITEAKRLIRFNTVTSETNAECAVYVGALFRKLGLQVVYQESRQEGVLFMNVAGLLGNGKGPLLLTTHLDTVAPGEAALWTKTGGDPWKLTRRGDTLYGLGTADTKLDLLCKMLAVAQVIPKKPKRSLILAGTFGEESGLRGAARFCQGELPKPSMVLVGEPSEMNLVTRHKGLWVGELLLKSKGLYRPTSAEWVYEVFFQGRAAHSSTPRLGANAIEASLRFLQNLRKRHSKVMVLSWTGGTGHNIIPASSSLRFSLGSSPRQSFRPDRLQRVGFKKLPPGWYPTLPWGDLLWAVEKAQEGLRPLEKEKDPAFEPPGLTWNLTMLKEGKEGWLATLDVRPLPGQRLKAFLKRWEEILWKQWGHPGPTWQFRLERDNSPLETDGSSPLVKLAKRSLQAARLPVKIAAKSGCSEAGLYSKVGIPAVVIGPGRSQGNIHSPNESVGLRQLASAVRFYKNFLERACF
ncbi:MAG: M20/M25/M40 family metallo-hydrolase [Candidatus Omnitrophica bacterium]|nr:M20/M25/M40 family metallo-hydrolase [Candidatus Omnitrophota bacterium]